MSDNSSSKPGNARRLEAFVLKRFDREPQPPAGAPDFDRADPAPTPASPPRRTPVLPAKPGAAVSPPAGAAPPPEVATGLLPPLRTRVAGSDDPRLRDLFPELLRRGGAGSGPPVRLRLNLRADVGAPCAAARHDDPSMRELIERLKPGGKARITAIRSRD